MKFQLALFCWITTAKPFCLGLHCWDCGRLPDYPTDRYIPCRFSQSQLGTPDQCHPSEQFCLTATVSYLDDSAEPYIIQQCSRSCAFGASVDRSRNIRITKTCCQENGCNRHSHSMRHLPRLSLISLLTMIALCVNQ